MGFVINKFLLIGRENKLVKNSTDLFIPYDTIKLRLLCILKKSVMQYS